MAEKKSKRASLPKGARRRRKPVGASTGLAAGELQAAAPPGAVAELHRLIEADEGKVLSAYRDPYGGQWLVQAALPIDLVEPTPYQRNLSDTHVRKLEGVIGKIGRFLDPIIAVRIAKPDHQARYWTPNGNHRLSAMRTLGAKSIIAIVVPEAAAAYQISWSIYVSDYSRYLPRDVSVRATFWWTYVGAFIGGSWISASAVPASAATMLRLRKLLFILVFW